ncbi:MAG TPA: hypothetical protein VGI20_12020 [Rhizomicrobium sp.]
MASRILPAISAALLLAAAPAWAMQTVTLPQPSDASEPYQSPDNPGPNNFSTNHDNTTDSALGHFHFSASSDPGSPYSPGYYYRSGGSSPAGYGTSNAPGSEFYNLGTPFPH